MHASAEVHALPVACRLCRDSKMQEPAPTRGQLRIKAATAVATAVLAGSLVLIDWDDGSGRPNVFSGLRPALKAAVSQLWGATTTSPQHSSPSDSRDSSERR